MNKYIIISQIFYLSLKKLPSPCKEIGAEGEGSGVRLVEKNGATSEIRTPDPRITSALLWPTELRWLTAPILYIFRATEKGNIAKNPYFWENESPLF